MKEFSADSGTAIVDQPPPDEGQFISLALDLITPSLTNRKKHDPVKLQALSESIKKRGVRFPITVRPLPASRVEDTSFEPLDPRAAWPFSPDRTKKTVRPTHEIVSGERRYLASLMAGRTTIPAIIRLTDDVASMEDQLIENLQREDLSDLQEAEGYHQLMEMSKMTVDQVAEKLDLGRSYVYSHLKLLDLTHESKAALEAGTIDYSRALLIARIPNGKLQEKAIKAAAEKNNYTDQPMSLRDFQTWLRQNVMLRLDTAPFKITDAALMPEAGSCKDCPKRTGANPELFAEVDGADICTDPTCYGGKATQHRKVLIEKAEAKGMRVIEGKEAKAIIKSQHSNTMEGYSRLDQKRADVSDDEPTLRKLLGPDAPGRVLIENPHTKELIEAIPTEEAEALLVTKGLLAAAKVKSKDAGKLDEQIEQLRSHMNSSLILATRMAIFKALGKKIHATKDDKAQTLITAQLLRIHLLSRFDSYDIDAGDDEWGVIINTPVPEGQDGGELACEATEAAPMSVLWKIFATFLLLDDCNSYQDLKKSPSFDAIAKTLRVDTVGIAQATKETMREEVNAKIKALRAEAAAAKKPAKDPIPLAQPSPAAKTAKPAGGGTKAGKKPGRLSPEDAQLGIAEAMQGIEGKPAPAGLRPVEAWPFPTAPTSTAAPTEGAAKASKFVAGPHAEPRAPRDASSSPDGADIPAGEPDPLLERAVALVVREQKATVRLLKTEMGIGTDKAMELMAGLEKAGKVSACDQRGARKVLVTA